MPAYRAKSAGRSGCGFGGLVQRNDCAGPRGEGFQSVCTAVVGLARGAHRRSRRTVTYTTRFRPCHESVYFGDTRVVFKSRGRQARFQVESWGSRWLISTCGTLAGGRGRGRTSLALVRYTGRRWSARVNGHGGAHRDDAKVRPRPAARGAGLVLWLAAHYSCVHRGPPEWPRTTPGCLEPIYNRF